MKTAIEHAARQPRVPPERGAEWAPRTFWTAPMPANFDAPTAGPAEALEVRVNHGRWIVECPDCSNAQLACETDHRFLCDVCGNAAIGGKYRPTIWPVTSRAGIEGALVVRPIRNQHWTPGETVLRLLEENSEHGLR